MMLLDHISQQELSLMSQKLCIFVSADEEEDEEDEEENTSPEKKVTVQEALAAAQTLQSFLDYHGDDVHQHSLVQLKCLFTDTLVSSSKQA